MKQIFFLVRSLNDQVGGGSHFNAIEQIRLFRKLGYDVRVHTFTSGNNHAPADIKVNEHQFQGKFLQEHNTLLNILREYESQTDLFFLYGVDFLWGAGKYKRYGGKRPVSVYLDTYLPSMFILREHTFSQRIKRFIWDKYVGLKYANYVDYFLAVSPWLQQRYVNFGFKESQFRIFPNFFKLKTQHLDTDKKILNETIKLLYTGRITYDKGVDLLVEAVRFLPHKSWSLTIVGDGNLKKLIVEKISNYGLADHIKLHSWMSQEKLIEIYRHADIFVHPARWPEPFGRTIVEALEHGMPVVVPENGGSAWIALSSGYQFKNGNLSSLSRVLNYAVKDFSLNHEERIVQAVEQARSFSINVQSKTIQRLLEEMI